jgi:hypothetical protein
MEPAPGSVLLDRANELLEQIGSTGRLLEVPEDHPDYASLKGKSVMMVDDTKRLLENFIPDLVRATDGNASVIHYKGENPMRLTADIKRTNPDVLLLDFHLSEDLKGDGVAR